MTVRKHNKKMTRKVYLPRVCDNKISNFPKKNQNLIKVKKEINENC